MYSTALFICNANLFLFFSFHCPPAAVPQWRCCPSNTKNLSEFIETFKFFYALKYDCNIWLPEPFKRCWSYASTVGTQEPCSIVDILLVIDPHHMITDQSTAQSPKGATGLFLPTIYLSNNSAVKTFFKADMHAQPAPTLPTCQVSTSIPRGQPGVGSRLKRLT